MPKTAEEWRLRVPGTEADEHDTNSISGPVTGRKTTSGLGGLLDDTWPAAVDIARGKFVESADSLAKYRRRNRNGKKKQNAGRRGRQNNKSMQ